MSACIGAVTAPRLHVMSFNVRRSLDGLAWRRADRWRTRRVLVAELLRTERPTVLGVQEALPDQAAAIHAALGPAYRMLGRGRGRRGRGEGTPLFYDAERLQLRRGDQVALSARPDRAGSRSFGNLIPRIAVTASFEDLETGGRLLVVNTHLDPFSPRSRMRSAGVLLALVEAGGLPAVVLGDMNARARSATMRAFLDGGALRDAWRAAERHAGPEWGMHPRYRSPSAGGARIDWILTTPGIRVTDAAINATTVGGAWPSDHLPVQTVLRLPAGDAS